MSKRGADPLYYGPLDGLNCQSRLMGTPKPLSMAGESNFDLNKKLPPFSNEASSASEYESLYASCNLLSKVATQYLTEENSCKKNMNNGMVEGYGREYDSTNTGANSTPLTASVTYKEDPSSSSTTLGSDAQSSFGRDWGRREEGDTSEPEDLMNNHFGYNISLGTLGHSRTLANPANHKNSQKSENPANLPNLENLTNAANISNLANAVNLADRENLENSPKDENLEKFENQKFENNESGENCGIGEGRMVYKSGLEYVAKVQRAFDYQGYEEVGLAKVGVGDAVEVLARCGEWVYVRVVSPYSVFSRRCGWVPFRSIVGV